MAIEIKKNEESVELLSPREENVSGRRAWLTGPKLLRWSKLLRKVTIKFHNREVNEDLVKKGEF